MIRSVPSPHRVRAFFSLGFSAASLLAASAAAAAPLAFPGAEGFGAQVTGGRAGKVYHVTTLSDSGPGSLRDAVSQSNRLVVFDVSGVITITSRLVITGDNITLAGQSAPGDGIAIYGDGTSFSGRKNIIVRFLRFRQGIDTGDGVKAVNITDGQNMIFDHVVVQWGRWDNFGITGGSSAITLQNSIIGEGIDPQRFGSIIDSAQDITVARNLWIHNQSRNPKFKANGNYVNNVVYDWGGGGGVVGGHSSADWYEDLINNYLIAGPAAADGFLNGYASTDRVYQTGNLVDLNRNGKLDGRPVVTADFEGDTPPTFETAAHNKPAVPVTVLSTLDAYDRVLAQAGTCQHRDAVELRLIGHLKSLGTSGAIITQESLVGGQPAMPQVTRPATFDADGDGMADAWETAHGLKPNDASDGSADANGDGYTNLEEYLNSLADAACSTGGPTTPPGDPGNNGPTGSAGSPALDPGGSAGAGGGAPAVGGSANSAAAGTGATGGTAVAPPVGNVGGTGTVGLAGSNSSEPSVAGATSQPTPAHADAPAASGCSCSIASRQKRGALGAFALLASLLGLMTRRTQKRNVHRT